MVRVFVVGVGMTKFEKPGGKVCKNAVVIVLMWLPNVRKPGRGTKSEVMLCVCLAQDWDYPDMARIAATRALKDACVEYTEVEQV